MEVTFHKLEKRARKEHSCFEIGVDVPWGGNHPDLREGEDALVDGCELSEAASTVETTERGR